MDNLRFVQARNNHLPSPSVPRMKLLHLVLKRLNFVAGLPAGNIS